MKLTFTDEYVNIDLKELIENSPKEIKKYFKAEAKAIGKLIKEEENILEIGCGDGRLYIEAELYNKELKYVGIDKCASQIHNIEKKFQDYTLSESILAYDMEISINAAARKMHSKIEIIHGDYREHTFKEKFDKIIINWNLLGGMIYDDNSRFIIKISKELKPKGEFIATGMTPNAIPQIRKYYRNVGKKVDIVEEDRVLTMVKPDNRNGFDMGYYIFTLKEVEGVLKLHGAFQKVQAKQLTPISYIATARKK